VTRKLILLVILFSLGSLLLLWEKPVLLLRDAVFEDEMSLTQISILIKDRKTKEAEEKLNMLVMKKNVSKDPHGKALYNVGFISLMKAMSGDKSAGKNALFYFKEALRIDPSIMSSKINLELLLRMGGEQKSGRREQGGKNKSNKKGKNKKQMGDNESESGPEPNLYRPQTGGDI